MAVKRLAVRVVVERQFSFPCLTLLICAGYDALDVQYGLWQWMGREVGLFVYSYMYILNCLSL